jgi:hypothetical protein
MITFALRHRKRNNNRKKFVRSFCEYSSETFLGKLKKKHDNENLEGAFARAILVSDFEGRC